MHPVLFQIGSMEVRSYFVIVCLAFLIAALLSARRASALGLTAGQIAVLGSVTLVVGVVGARLGFLLDRWEDFRLDPTLGFQLWDGGLGFYAGAAMGLPVVAWVLHLYGKLVSFILDRTIRYLVLAVAITRIGCFLNGCCAGSPTDLPWGVVYPRELVRYHPTQLYESAGMFGLFFLLKRLERRNLPPGAILFTAFLYYGLLRFGLEFIREDLQPALLGFSVTQWISLGLIAWGIAELLRRR
jgi:phosphatidylglycerol:prolipoprotein diacylglycerol transferase